MFGHPKLRNYEYNCGNANSSGISASWRGSHKFWKHILNYILFSLSYFQLGWECGVVWGLEKPGNCTSQAYSFNMCWEYKTIWGDIVSLSFVYHSCVDPSSSLFQPIGSHTFTNDCLNKLSMTSLLVRGTRSIMKVYSIRTRIWQLFTITELVLMRRNRSEYLLYVDVYV
jgi:hypothetical protein